MDNKRAGSAAATTICLVLWGILRVVRCEAQQHRYDYDYTPNFSYQPSWDLPKFDEPSVDKTKQAVEALLTADASWRPAIVDTDPIAIAANPKNPPCTALDAVDEETPTWTVRVSESVLVADAMETTVKSPYPIYIAHEQDEEITSSPEATARSIELYEKSIDGGYVATPTLSAKDLFLQAGVMPKPSKTVKRVKGIAPGTAIVRGWIYDHAAGRVVCAGVVAIPKPGKGDKATKLSDEQITKLVKSAPDALRTLPLPAVEAEDTVK